LQIPAVKKIDHIVGINFTKEGIEGDSLWGTWYHWEMSGWMKDAQLQRDEKDPSIFNFNKIYGYRPIKFINFKKIVVEY